jgi:hypothetical protein
MSGVPKIGWRNVAIGLFVAMLLLVLLGFCLLPDLRT